jgi:hypothetical protein
VKSVHEDARVGERAMTRRNRNQLIYANTMPDRWLRTAVAVAEPDLTGVLLRCWQGSQRIPVTEPGQGSKKRSH